MIAAAAISGRAPAAPALDWAGLVAEGRALLEAMSDGRWTDFNAHDPGITILETFAYALTDLGYRAGHPVADLVHGAPALSGPDELLAGRAVTLVDLRRAAIAVPGVRNAWIEPSTHPALRLRHLAGAGELAFEHRPNDPGEPVRLRGVHRVLVEKSPRDDRPSGEVARAVAAALHAQRNLGEDFDEARVLDPLPVAVASELEIDDPARAETILLDAWAALDLYCSPDPGRLVDDAPERRRALQLSDVVAVLAATPGVRATRRVRLGLAGEDLSGPARWSLPVPADRVPRFEPRGAAVRLIAGGGVALDSSSRDDLAARFGGRPAAPLALDAPAPLPVGRDRHLADYHPLRLDLPAVYGVRPGGLDLRASPERRAHADQLRAYLALFDALLANQFAQLAAAGALLAPAGGATPSYAVQPAERLVTPTTARADDESPIHADTLSADTLQSLVEPPGADAGVDRRNRLAAHLLARHGEEAPSVPPPASLGFGPDLPASRRVLAARGRFLTAFPRLSAGRGTGADLLDERDESPLLDRIRLKLGLADAEGDRLRLVEHILLRAIADDEGQAQPLLAAAARADPYSLQLSLVADAALQPAAEALARVAREETPAHLVLYLRWLDGPAFDAFAVAEARWRATLRAQRREALGFGVEAS